MELYIIRHSLAHYQGQDGSNSDADRTLTAAGVERAKGVGRGLAKLGIIPDVVFVSPAVRTQQTAKHIFDQLPMPQGSVRSEKAVGLSGSVNAIIELLQTLATRPERVAVVGHEPTMGELISELLSGKRDLSVKVGRASVTRIDFGHYVGPKNGELVWKMHAAHLMALGESAFDPQA